MSYYANIHLLCRYFCRAGNVLFVGYNNPVGI